jgi:tetratricopeptide (TPR) repeat protein
MRNSKFLKSSFKTSTAASSKNPKKVDIQPKIKLLNSKVREGDWLEAEELSGKMLSSFPNNWEILIPAAEAKFNLDGQEQEGLKLMERAVNNCKSADPLLRVTVERLKSGKIETAGDIAKFIIAKFNKCVVAYEILGICLKRGGKFEEAIKAFEKASELEKNKFSVWMNMGNAYMEWKKFEKAIKAYEKAEIIEKANPEPLRLQGGCLISMGQHQKAVEILCSALAIDPTSSTVKHDLAAAYYNLGLFRDAMSTVKSGLEANSNDQGLLRIANAIVRRIQ